MSFHYWLLYQIVFFVSIAGRNIDKKSLIHFHTSYAKDSPYYIPDAKVSKRSLDDPMNYANLTSPPDTVYIARSTIPNSGLGAFAERMIEEGTFFGPYTGDISRTLSTFGDYSYAWAICNTDDRRILYIVDAIDPRNSNWLRYANCPVKGYQQNLVAVQYDGEIYYQTIRNIEKDEELFVYYGHIYAKTLHIDTTQSFYSLKIIPTETSTILKVFHF